MVAKVVPGLPTFKELGRPDLRNTTPEMRREAIAEVQAADSAEEAVLVLEQHLGFLQAGGDTLLKNTPIGEVSILREKLIHIVEKRMDARERFVRLALDTLEDPFEIWETMYDDDQVRYIFIGIYQQRYQMLVIVAPWEGRLLWNFMHAEAKSLNKNRNGRLIYARQ